MKKIRATRYAVRAIIIVLIILGALHGLYQAGFIQGILCNFTTGNFSVSCPLGFVQLSLSVRLLVLALLVSSLFFIVISLIFGRVFCSWICPMGLVNETVHYLKGAVLRRRTKHTRACSQCSTSPSSTSPRFPGMLSIGRSVKYIFLASVIIVSVVVRYPVFCLICPVGILCRNLLSLSSFNLLTLEVSIVGVIFLSDFFLLDRGWCGGLCPLGALYSLLGKFKIISLRTEKKKVEGLPPCRATCPASVNVQGYTALLRQGKTKEALELIRKDNPFPAVCSMVCFRPCEADCERGKVDEPVAINALKRFVADHWLEEGVEKPKPLPKIHEENVAVIGSGPAGLAAAYELIRKGYPVTVFESLPEPGGMLRVGIPKYRLSREVLDAEIQHIRELGVEIRNNARIGGDLTIDNLLREGYKAIFIAIGAHKSRKLDIEGEELKGVIHALNFLKEVNLGKKVEVGDKVAVIGGGNVAVDAARTALRLGSKEVHILYRRSKEEMPAYHEEVEQGEREGVKISFLVSPKKILGKDGQITAIECIRMRLGAPDKTGRRRPIPIEGSEFITEFDTLIIAIGERPDLFTLPQGVKVTKWNTIAVDSVTLQTSLPHIFAGGDVVSGPANIIEAIAAGKRAAVSIDRYLKGEDLKMGREEEIKKVREVPKEGVVKKARQPMPLLQPDQRVGNFKQIELGFTEEMAMGEAERCLLCGECSECLGCDKLCRELCPMGIIPTDQGGIGECSNCGLCKEICVCEKASPRFLHPKRWKDALTRIFRR